MTATQIMERINRTVGMLRNEQIAASRNPRRRRLLPALIKDTHAQLTDLKQQAKDKLDQQYDWLGTNSNDPDQDEIFGLYHALVQSYQLACDVLETLPVQQEVTA